MLEELQKPSDIDPSGLFSTYKTHPSENDETVEGETNHIKTVFRPTVIEDGSKRNVDSNSIKALRIFIDGSVRMTKVVVWGIAVFGGLFITALATNTIDRAVDIINTNLGTQISISGEVDVQKVSDPQNGQTPTTVPGITNSTVSNLTSNVSDTLASKRRAILEAKKAAKMLEEKQQELEQSL